MKKKTTVVSFLLDETGSMQAIKDDTIGGFNSYLGALSADENKYEFTLVKFDSNKTEKVCVAVPVEEAPRLAHDTYMPGAATPLVDASYKIIEATEKAVGKRKVNVLVVIQTDGHENASTQHTREDLARLIKEKTAQGWVFVYLGAGIDAFDDAASFGIAAGATMSYDMAASAETFRAVAQNTSSYASSGNAKAMNFTGQQRSASGDVYHGSHSGSPSAKLRRRHQRSQRQSSPSLADDLDLTK